MIEHRWTSLYSLFVFVVTCLIFLSGGNASQLDSVLTDSTLYHITWPGPFTVHPSKKDRETLKMVTKNKESYVCTIPDTQEKYRVRDSMQKHDNPRNLIDSLWGTCSYRIETYWTYEICHGKSLRQYHERMEAGKVVQVQEYSLGYYTGTWEQDLKENDLKTRAEFMKRTFRLGNDDLAYIPINFTDGTICDITGKPRTARLKYICHQEGRGEILEIKETSTCNYDVVIMTKLLCGHPAFTPEINLSNNIECFAMDAGKRRPIDLNRMELEAKAYEAGLLLPEFKPSTPKPEPKLTKTKDPLFLDIMKGVFCFTGGLRVWWSHELCLNKYVQQFHDDKKTGVRTKILLGGWNVNKHIAWLKLNEEKIFHKGDDTVHFFYSNGDWCDFINDYRSVVVKLHCQSNSVHSDSFSTKLEEISACRYKLTVQSGMLCPVLEHLNDEGLLILE